MDVILTVLFYVYVALAFSAPLFVIPAIVICRKLSNPFWKGAIVCIPWLGLPLFVLMIHFTKKSTLQPLFFDRR